MTNQDLTARIRAALDHLEGGHGEAAAFSLKRLVEDLEAGPSVRLNGPAQLSPRDLPEDGKLEVTNSGGEWAVYYFADAMNRMYDASGGGDSIEDACREALEDAE